MQEENGGGEEGSLRGLPKRREGRESDYFPFMLFINYTVLFIYLCYLLSLLFFVLVN